jgi:hypothetical protein
MTRPATFVPALFGGLFIAVLSLLPFVRAGNYCCCLWVVVGGLLAAYVTQQNHPWPITLGDGLRAGALAGLTGAVLALAAGMAIDLFYGDWASRYGADLLEAYPDGSAELRAQRRALTHDRGMLVATALFAVLYVAVDVTFAAIGGLVGVLFFKKPAPPRPLPGSPAPFATTASSPAPRESWPPVAPPDDTP